MFTVKLPPDIAFVEAKIKLPLQFIVPHVIAPVPVFIDPEDKVPVISKVLPIVVAPLMSTAPFNDTSFDIIAFPVTSNVRLGADVAIPTFPLPRIVNNSVPDA